MWCLQLHSSPLLLMHEKLKPHQQLHTQHTTKLLWFTNTEPSRSVPQRHHFASASQLRIKALPQYSIVLAAATSPPKSGDISAFLPVSALLLLFYFIANFAVPELIAKYFGFDKVNEDQKVDDVNGIEDEYTGHE